MSETPKAPPAVDDSELDPNSLAAIRDLLANEETQPGAPVQPISPQPEAEQRAAAAPKRERFSPLSPQSQTDVKRQKAVKPSKPQGEGMVDLIKAKVLGYRPTPKHIVLGCVALLVLFRPWLVLGLLFLFAFILTGVFLILGYDGFWRRVMGIARWYARKHPSRSGELHRKLDNFAVRFDAFLDRFPEGSVDGLYLPDFGDLAAEEARHDEALDRRFESLRENEA